MIIISQSFVIADIQKQKKHFKKNDILPLVEKVNKGFGIPIKKDEDGNIIKVKTNIRGVATRSLFFLQTKSGDIIPITLKLKKDSLGENMSLKNLEFKKFIDARLDQIEQDIELGNFEIIDFPLISSYNPSRYE